MSFTSKTSLFAATMIMGLTLAFFSATSVQAQGSDIPALERAGKGPGNGMGTGAGNGGNCQWPNCVCPWR